MRYELSSRSKWRSLVYRLWGLEFGQSVEVPIPEDQPIDAYHARIYRVVARYVRDEIEGRIVIRRSDKRSLILTCRSKIRQV